jgi:alkylation response protein AidB-like acyl-CoA dehydrogenase
VLQRPTRPELDAVVERATTIAGEVLAPNAEAIDREGAYPTASVAALRRSGLLGLLVPTDYGGIGGEAFTYARVVMALARACASTAMIFVMHNSVVRNITRRASEVTRQRFLPAVARGECLFCSNRNEPEASTTQGYIGDLRESLEPLPDGGYRFTTVKHFATGSPGADYLSVLGRLVGSAPGQGELWVLVDRHDPALEIVENWDALGMRGTRSNYVHYNGCTIAPDCTIGVPGPPLFGDYTTVGQAVVSLAIAENALEFGLRFLRGEVGEVHGVDLTRDANIQRGIGEQESLIDAARMMLYQLCQALEEGDRAVIQQTQYRAWWIAKKAGSEVPLRILQLVGGRGSYRRFPLERYLRDGATVNLMGQGPDALATLIGRTSLTDGPGYRGLWLT